MRASHALPLVGLLLVLLTSTSGAQPGNTAPGQTAPYADSEAIPPTAPHIRRAPVQSEMVNYGWHVFAADAAGWALLSTSGESEVLGSIGGFAIFLGAPTVHLAHGNLSGAGYSLLARTALPLGGGLLLAATCDDRDGWDCIGRGFLGAALGYAGALVIDWFVLAKTSKPIATTGWASLRPMIEIAPDRAQASVGFQF